MFVDMGAAAGAFPRAALLLAVVSIVEAANSRHYFTLGGGVELKPVQAAADITRVTWKHNGDVVVEWVKDAVELEFYGVLQNRASMDKTTALLRITDMAEENKGVYTVDINDRPLKDQYEVVFLMNVSAVTVEVRPLTCSSSNKNCSLICHTNLTGVEPVTYYWKEGEKDWVEGKKEKDIKNIKDEKQPETFSCRIQNPVSKNDSKTLKNPLIESPTPGPISAGKIIGYLILALVLLLALLLLVFYLLRNRQPFSQWWSWLMKKLRRDPAATQNNGAAHQESHSPDDPAAQQMVSKGSAEEP